jgi:hypothetical protein
MIQKYRAYEKHLLVLLGLWGPEERRDCEHYRIEKLGRSCHEIVLECKVRFLVPEQDLFHSLMILPGLSSHRNHILFCESSPA